MHLFHSKRSRKHLLVPLVVTQNLEKPMGSAREAIGLEGLAVAVVTEVVFVIMAKVNLSCCYLLLKLLLLPLLLLVVAEEVEEEVVVVELLALDDDLVELVVAMRA